MIFALIITFTKKTTASPAKAVESMRCFALTTSQPIGHITKSLGTFRPVKMAPL